MNSFNKDAWIKDALVKRYLIVTSDGTIRRCSRASRAGELMSNTWAIVKPRTHKSTGRVYFNLTWRGVTKSVLVNRVVALRFLPNSHNLPQVNHIDGNKQNNAVSNLEWASGSENERHAHRTGLKTGRGSANANAKLTANDVCEIRQSKESAAFLASKYNVSRSTIFAIVNNKTWRHLL